MTKYSYKGEECYGIKWKLEDRVMVQLLSDDDIFIGSAVENLSEGVFKYAYNIDISYVEEVVKKNTIGGKLC